jgi:hypothetical protein
MIAFIACIEQGYLENQTKLLCRSIRKYGGRFCNTPIYTFQPRQGTAVSDETLSVLNDLGVVHITEPLNTAFPNYGVANKIYACAWAEEMLTEDVLVFLDSDTLILNEPAAFDLPGDIDAAARPVDRKGIGSIGPGDPNDWYWLRLYELCGLENTSYVETTVNAERIHPYFNAGLIVARRSTGIFCQWKSDFLYLIGAHHIPSNGKMWYMDQCALAATLGRIFDRVQILNWRYNYPMTHRWLLAPPFNMVQLEECIHVHYHKWFSCPHYLQRLWPPLNPDSEVVQWLEPYLPLEPILKKPLPHTRYARAMNRLKALKNKVAVMSHRMGAHL